MHITSTEHTPALAAQEALVNTTPTTRKQQFQSVFNSERAREHFSLFLKNVFMSLDETKFYTLMDDILKKNPSYEELYSELSQRITQARPGRIKTLLSQFRALRVIKKVLVEQVQKLLCPKLTVEGYAELGYSGRLIRSLNKAGISLLGSRTVINDKQRLTDYIEAGIPLPYHTFVPLQNYTPLTNSIQPESLELVICPIGLHHCPSEKLDAYIQSIHAVIAPGGSFILRDHDVTTPELDALVNVVHSVFNAATGETLETELEEKRNFTDLSSWCKKLEAHGFQLEQGSFTQDADPTKNTLVRFTKKSNEANTLTALERTMRLSYEGYRRAPEQTHLTSVEWHLVASAKEYADALKSAPPSKFPYLCHVKTLWETFVMSSYQAVQASTICRVISSEYMLMNLFMLVSTTGELVFRRISATNQESSTTKKLAVISDEYAEFIKTVPFYNFPYMAKVKELWKAFCPKGVIGAIQDLFLTAMTTLEFTAKAITSAPIAATYQGVEPGRIFMIVEDPDNCALLKEYTVRISGQYKALHVPRYEPFTNLVKQLSENNIRIMSIAGQKNVQVKVKTPRHYALDAIEGTKKLGEIAIATSDTHKYVRLDVATTALSSTIKMLQEKECTATYIHDF